MLGPLTEPEMIAEFLRRECASKDAVARRYPALASNPSRSRGGPDIATIGGVTPRRRVLARYVDYGTQEPSYLTSFPIARDGWG